MNKYDNNYKCIFITSSAAPCRPGLYEQLYIHIKTPFRKHSATKEAGNLQKTKLRDLGNNWQKNQVLHNLHTITCFLLVKDRRSHGHMAPSLPFPVPAKPDPALCYLLQATSEKSWILFSPLLGLLLQSVLSPFTGVSKSTALAEQAHREHHEGLRVLPLPRAVVSGSP